MTTTNSIGLGDEYSGGRHFANPFGFVRVGSVSRHVLNVSGCGRNGTAD